MAGAKKRKLKSKTLSQSRKPFWEGVLEWILGFAKKLMIPALVLWLVTWLWVGGIFAKTGDAIWDGFVKWTATQGLVVNDIVINGRYRTDIDNLRNAIDVTRGGALLAVNVDAIQTAVAKLTWVEDVAVRRSYNGVVTVDITERVPFVIWQRPGLGQVLVDQSGTPIDGVALDDYRRLLVVEGVDAPKYASDLMTMIRVEQQVAGRIKGAQWVGDRRWNLVTVNDTVIMLPEDDIGYALSRLAKIQDEKNILARDLLSIDLRHPDRIIVESKQGQAEDISATAVQPDTNAI